MAKFTNRKIATYAHFWPYYLQEHATPRTRALHYIGTTIEIGSAVALIATGNLWFLLGAAVGGYAFAWIGHFFIEKNRPAGILAQRVKENLRAAA